MDFEEVYSCNCVIVDIIHCYIHFMQIQDRGFNELDADPEEHPVLFIADPMLKFAGQEKGCMIEIMFEKFNTYSSHQYMYNKRTAYLSLVSYGRTACTVIESGDGISCVATISVDDDLFNWYCLDLACRHGSFKQSCQTLSYFLTDFHNEGHYSQCQEEFMLCYVVQDIAYEMEIVNTTSSLLEMSFELLDGQVLTLNSERFRCPEPLFKPSFPQAGLQCNYWNPQDLLQLYNAYRLYQQA